MTNNKGIKSKTYQGTGNEKKKKGKEEHNTLKTEKRQEQFEQQQQSPTCSVSFILWGIAADQLP
jgi:hypothetical protein